MLTEISAPFTDDEVRKINEWQRQGKFHPFTCCSPDDIEECSRKGKEVNGEYIEGSTSGILVATNDGMICPCGKYTQDWVYSYMLSEQK